ncbi:uncharacterized protein LOC144180540 [Haemaphysalis longicornis]
MRIEAAIAFFVVLTTPPEAFCGDYLKDLFKRGEQRDVMMYLCYRNGTTFEPAGSRNLQLLWTGHRLPENEAHLYSIFVLPGEQNRRNGSLTAVYLPEKGYAKLVAKGKEVQRLYLLEPAFNGEAYYVKQVGLSQGGVVLKIFDTDQTCKNAKEQRARVCPDPCNWEYTN